MGKVIDFLEQKSYILMTIFMILQGVLFSAFMFIFFIENDQNDWRYKLYICGTMGIFFVFMVHFAYHSVIKSFF
jgi:hypothetical protein